MLSLTITNRLEKNQELYRYLNGICGDQTEVKIDKLYSWSSSCLSVIGNIAEFYMKLQLLWIFNLGIYFSIGTI